MPVSKNNHTIVIGGGVAGLVAAYYLGKAGLPVTLIEAGNSLGGLASSFVFDGETIERYYHFICKTDEDYFDLLQELGIAEKLQWESGITSFFYEGSLYRFATPIDLISFRPVPLLGRIRFGLNLIRDRFRKNWENIDKHPAREWLISQIGQTTYDVIWDPLLRIKFGKFHNKISAAWVWHRIHRVARSRKRIWEPEQLGFLLGGTQKLIEELEKNLSRMPNVTICLGQAVTQIITKKSKVQEVVFKSGEKQQCSSVISTITLDRLQTIIDDNDYRRYLSQFTYIGVICGLLKLNHPLTKSFWVNINDQNIPFNGIIEYSNLNSHIRETHQASYIYIPHYLVTSDQRFGYSDKRLMEEYIEGFKLINSEFDTSWILASNISRSKRAQAICSIGFKEIMPSTKSPIEGLYITDSTLYYPEDRTISASIRLAKKAAEFVFEKEKIENANTDK